MSAGYLLDTCAVLWALLDKHELSARAEDVMLTTTSPLYLSAISVWEITNKFNLGKLPHAASVAKDVVAACQRLRVEHLPLSVEHAQIAGLLPYHHRDPFDRMLVAQAKHHKLTIISNDNVFKAYKVKVLW
jgi:PIN domain nuclease of toxin-antitoxin system